MKKNSSKDLSRKSKVSSNVHVEAKTTKKTNISKNVSCARMNLNSEIKSSKASLLKINTCSNDVAKNEALMEENRKLREEFCRLQDLHLKDKEKIKILISRISQMKKEVQTRPQTPQREKSKTICEDRKCHQRKKYLEMELHKQRVKVNELIEEKKEWQGNKQKLKGQYQQLLGEIANIRHRS